MKSDIDVPFFNVVEICSGIKFWDDYISKGIIKANDKVKARVGNEMQEVERWETSTRVIDFLLSPKEREKMLSEIQNAYQLFFSFERKKILLLKTVLRAIRSKFMLNMVYNISKNFKEAMNAIMTFRSSKPRGFGTYDD